MRALCVGLCIVACAACCLGEGETRGRDLAIRGMKMVARQGATETEKTRGWDLVAKGVGVLLSLPGKWEEPGWMLRGDMQCFLSRCAWAGGLPAQYAVDGIRPYDVTRDTWGDCDAFALDLPCVPWRTGEFGPRMAAAQMLFARVGDSIVAGGWSGYVGHPATDHPVEDRGGRLAAWVSGDDVWAVIAGAKGGGGTGCWPSAVVLRRSGMTWRVLNRFDIDRGWKNDFGLDDLNHDGIPEIVGTISTFGRVTELRPPASEYVVYRRVRGRYRKVWYAKVETPEACLGRFAEARLPGRGEYFAHAVMTSPEVMAQAKSTGLWEHGLHSVELREERSSARATTGLRENHWRIDLSKLEDGRWRISGISRLDDNKEDTSP